MGTPDPIVSIDRLPGLQFRKLDLHVHTPASKDFIGEATPDEIVARAIGAGLSGIAVTDHNTGDWIDKIQSAAAKTSLTVFPGVEITCAQGKRNIHLIALFDPERDGTYINAMLHALGLAPHELGSPTAIVNKTITDIIDCVQEKYGGIAVLAHANSSSGVLQDIQGTQRTQIIQHPSLMAAESTDYFDEQKKAARKRVADLLDGSDPVYQRRLAVYQASDNPAPDNQHGHSLDGIGYRHSFFKMESINLDSLRQCLMDPETRIRIQEPQPPSHPRIVRISIKGGFLDGESVPFHVGMNSILGGKGVGKSALIEFMRFALGQPPANREIRDDHTSKLRSLLGAYGTVTLTFMDATGKTYEYATILRSDGSAEHQNTEYDPADVLPVLFLSQNEIIKLAEHEDAQLEFIDRFFDFRQFRRNILATERDLGELDKQMADCLRAFRECSELQPQVSTLQEEVAKLERSLDSEVFKRFQHADNKRSAIDRQLQHLGTMRTRLQHIAVIYDGLEEPELVSDLESDPILLRNRDVIAGAKSDVEQALQRSLARLDEAEAQVRAEAANWNDRFTTARTEYDAHVQTSGGDYKALARLRDQKRSELERQSQRLAAAKKRRDKTRQVSESRDKLLDVLDTIYSAYTQARQERCQRIEGDARGRLRLRIIPSSDTTAFRGRLLSLKQGSYLRQEEIDAICSTVPPRQFIRVLLRYSLNPDSSKELAPLTDLCGIPMTRLVKLADFLLEGIEYEFLLELQYRTTPQDRPEILFNVGSDEYRPLSAVSVGQKSVALLLMALSNGDSPVVIDQPEDSLDIRAIWEDICVKLRLGKESRQFIFTTHNSSVAVASDSDYFVVLDGSATRGRVVFAGSMDHEPVSTQVLTYLEGGIETYGRKYAKYRAERRL